ncbi:MAG: hypothetical protein JW384_01280 [Nitrosomonadaceae bacterium]|nr:hypothetical protein [Nitrosomonadaceae bacterium]
MSGPSQQLLFPFGDLRGMDPELFGQVRQRLVAFDYRQCDLRLERRAVIPSWAAAGFKDTELGV